MSPREQQLLEFLLSQGPLKKHEIDSITILDSEFLATINKELSSVHSELRSCRDQYDGEICYGVVNNVPDERSNLRVKDSVPPIAFLIEAQSKLGTKYSVRQIAFFKGIIEEIAQAEAAQGCISRFDALNKFENELPSEASSSQQQIPPAFMNFSMSQKEDTLVELVKDKWLYHPNEGDIGLGMRTLLDQHSWFRNIVVPSCEVCNELGIKADLCPNEGCTVRIHKYCLRDLSSQKDVHLCSGCGKPWLSGTITKVEVIEEAATDGKSSLYPSASKLDWKQAEDSLTSRKIQTLHNGKEFKIFGLSNNFCNQQTFTRKLKNGDGESKEVETTVFKYFIEVYEIDLKYSSAFPCLNVGGFNHPIYLPIELCVPCYPVIDFVTRSQRVANLLHVNWSKAASDLKDMVARVPLDHNREFKISGLSEYSCGNQKITMKEKGKGKKSSVVIESTVYQYYSIRKDAPKISPDSFCIMMSNKGHHLYFPLECCVLVSPIVDILFRLQNKGKPTTSRGIYKKKETSSQAPPPLKPLKRPSIPFSLSPLRNFSNHHRQFQLHPTNEEREFSVAVGWDFENQGWDFENQAFRGTVEDATCFVDRLTAGLRNLRKRYFISKIFAYGDTRHFDPKILTALEKSTIVQIHHISPRETDDGTKCPKKINKGKKPRPHVPPRPKPKSIYLYKVYIRGRIPDDGIIIFPETLVSYFYDPIQNNLFTSDPLQWGNKIYIIGNSYALRVTFVSELPANPILAIAPEPFKRKRDAADTMIIIEAMKHALDFQPPGNILFITGDQDFSTTMKELDDRGFIVLVANDNRQDLLDFHSKASWDFPNISQGGSFRSINAGRREGVFEDSDEFGASSSLTGETGTSGLTGLLNLGNTCFLNSSLQCLAHTPKLVDFFLEKHRTQINVDNPLGTNGEIALAFGDLVRSLWAPGATTVPPSTFKAKLDLYAPQFRGTNQHDSQELLVFLLAGLHEDLKRIKRQPYLEEIDGDVCPEEEELADKSWRNHVAHNDSIIVDLCQGQLKSSLLCPICKQSSVKFDQFMCLSLPLPCHSMRTMKLTVMSVDGDSVSAFMTVNVPEFGIFEHLHKALDTACSLQEDETLLVTEVYKNQIIRFLEDPTDSLTIIGDGAKLVVYRLKKDTNNSPLVVFTHQKLEEQDILGKSSPRWRGFGVPLVSRLCDVKDGSDVEKLYLKLLTSFKRPTQLFTGDLEDGYTCSAEDTNSSDVKETTELRLYLTNDGGNSVESQVLKEKPLHSSKSKWVNVVARWPVKMQEGYDTGLMSSLPEVSEFGGAKKSVSLDKCLEAYLAKETLGPDDMWYCPRCKKERQAIKKLDLWRLPEILVIHLKRFSYTRSVAKKLDADVDFPLDDLDLSSYISYKDGQTTYRYMLYAISNHFGSMEGGHYTAYVRYGGGRWYHFDDGKVDQINQENFKTSAAYVLFYKRLE